jgi:perosamine synthetase
VAEERISLFRTCLRDDAIGAATAVLESGWLGLGPRTAEFEAAFAAYLGAGHCVGLDSGTAAMQLAMRLLDLPQGAEVVTTPLTFVSANQAILLAGLTPVFADVDVETGNLDPESVAARLTSRTGAVVVMRFAGQPCDLDELYGVAADAGIPLVEDCAHACGAVYRGQRIGTHGDVHAFSFGAVKNLPTGDGGALVVRSEKDAARLRRLRSFGVSASTYERVRASGYSWDYDVTELGFRCHMDDVSAAIGLVQLRVLEEDNARRREIVEVYRTLLAGVPGLELLRVDADRQSANHMFVVLVKRRDDLVAKLSRAGIDTGVHYRPSYDYGLFGGDPLPGVESLWRRAVSLPLHLALGDEDVERVASTIREGW